MRSPTSLAVLWGIVNDEADSRHGAQPFPMMRIMVMTAPFDQSAEIQTETPPADIHYHWLHGGVGNRGFPETTSSGQTTTCLPSCWIVIGL
jgi:hypothetical protein